MKRILFCLLLLLFLPHNAVMSQERILGPEELGEIENTTLRPFFNALVNGDVEAIKRYFSEKKSQATGLLDLEGEAYKMYSNKLKIKYEGVVFSVDRGAVSGNQIIIDVVMKFPGGGWGAKQYYLEAQSGNVDGVSDAMQWRITDERMKQ